MYRSVLSFVLGGLLVGVILWNWTAGSHPQDEVRRVHDAVAPTTAETAFTGFESKQQPTSTTRKVEPLPPLDEVPVATLFTSLGERARSGDVNAACRLARELIRCRVVAQWDEGSTGRRADQMAKVALDNDAMAKIAAELAETHEYNIGVKKRCEGLEAQQFRQIPRLNYLAAKSGHIPSMLDFADAAGVSSEDMIADPELYFAYRAEAWPMFTRAFEAGDPRAVTAWALALQSPAQFLGGVMPGEWRRPGLARALLERMRRELPQGAEHRILQPALGEQSRPTEAELAEADAMFQRTFAGSPLFRKEVDEPTTPPASARFTLSAEACE